MVPPIPSNEQERLAALYSYNILDSEAEQAFDDLALLASHICDTPIALISLVDGHRQWFKSKVGIEEYGTPRDISFCGHAILQPDLFVVADAAADERFASNPLVTTDPKIRFYAGMPLVDDGGYGLGTICVIDRKPRVLSLHQEQALVTLGRQVVSLLNLRRALKQKTEAELQLRTQSRLLANAEQLAKTGSWEYDRVSGRVSWSEGHYRLFNMTPDDEPLGLFEFLNKVHPDDVNQTRTALVEALQSGENFAGEYRIRLDDGTEKYIQAYSTCTRDEKTGNLKRSGSVQDITDRKNAEAAARAMHETLHAEQIKTLEQHKIVLQQQTQIETLREVTLALMDKINNPLAVIMLIFELWQRDHRLPQEILKNMESVRNAARRISAALQEVSRIDSYRTMETSYGKVLDVYSNEEQRSHALQ